MLQQVACIETAMLVMEAMLLSRTTQVLDFLRNEMSYKVCNGKDTHLRYPKTPFKVVPQVGVFAIADFVRHFVTMGLYTIFAESLGPVLSSTSASLPPPALRFRCKRLVEAWRFGSGLDYFDHE